MYLHSSFKSQQDAQTARTVLGHILLMLQVTPGSKSHSVWLE